MGVIKALSASCQAHDQFEQLANVPDAAYAACGTLTAARSVAVASLAAPAPSQHSLPLPRVPVASCRSM